MKSPIRVTVTGAAGNIGYATIFRVAHGDLFGADQPVILQLLEITPAMRTLEGIAMELEDCAFPLLADLRLTDDPAVAFDGANWALLIGSRPRTKGMERRDLLGVNSPIFVAQGQALNARAASDIRVVTVGNPANSNCLVALSSAPDIPAERFTAMTRLDHNRALSALARKAGVSVNAVRRMTVWGNHSSTQFPDAYHATIDGRPAPEVIGDSDWLEQVMIPQVQGRGAAVIEALGKSSAASAANAIVDHVRSWYHGTPEGDWVSMAIPSTGDYNTARGIVFSYPVTIRDGRYQVVQGLELSASARERLRVTGQELLDEREMVQSLNESLALVA